MDLTGVFFIIVGKARGESRYESKNEIFVGYNI
jgi:hypothetical protein